MNIERIREMEGYLNECAAVTAGLTEQLDRTDAVREDMIRLFSYYGSEAWYEDREGELPADVPAGVLSEDAVYDLLLDNHDLAVRMLKVIAKALENQTL